MWCRRETTSAVPHRVISHLGVQTCTSKDSSPASCSGPTISWSRKAKLSGSAGAKDSRSAASGLWRRLSLALIRQSTMSRCPLDCQGPFGASRRSKFRLGPTKLGFQRRRAVLPQPILAHQRRTIACNASSITHPGSTSSVSLHPRGGAETKVPAPGGGLAQELALAQGVRRDARCVGSRGDIRSDSRLPERSSDHRHSEDRRHRREDQLILELALVRLLHVPVEEGDPESGSRRRLFAQEVQEGPIRHAPSRE